MYSRRSRRLAGVNEETLSAIRTSSMSVPGLQVVLSKICSSALFSFRVYCVPYYGRHLCDRGALVLCAGQKFRNLQHYLGIR